MKIFKHILVSILAVFFMAACDFDNIDSISHVDPGSDETAPVVTINFPAEGTQIQVPELVASINIKFEVTDDIEIGSIKVSIDGTEIASYDNFKDYRRAVEELLYENVTNGAHTLTITATDLEGKSTSSSVNFEKAPPYIPIYDGEIFYLPFDGDYMEMISFQNATVVGNPGFAGESVQGLNAYAGATDSYLTFPTEGLLGSEFSAAFWHKIDASPDRAGLISISPTGESRTSGLRLFREGSATEQRFKLNVGTGAGETWNDGGTVDATADEWVHLAFTISETSCIVYINGAVATEVPTTTIDWTGCDLISIASGAPNFAYWDHKSDNSFYDELRLFNKALSTEEIQTIISNDSPYEPKYDSEVFYMPFEDNFDDLVSASAATEVGTPGFADGKVGKAYAGATDSYLTFPTDGLKNSEFSAAFWTKINADPDRAGILVMGPEDPDNANYPEKQNNRKSGFRFFREDAAGMQRFKLNAGNGTADSWFDGGTAADVDPTTGNWVHMAFTISGTECVVYVDGEVVTQGDFDGIDWTGCDILSIMSGSPRFTEWGHLNDLSLMDELRIFNKALTQAEIQTIIADEQ